MKTILFCFMFLAQTACYGQSSIIEVSCIYIVDKNGNITGYIRKSKSEEFKHPKKGTKVFFYNENLDIIGYWYGLKRKFIKLKIPEACNKKSELFRNP